MFLICIQKYYGVFIDKINQNSAQVLRVNSEKVNNEESMCPLRSRYLNIVATGDTITFNLKLSTLNSDRNLAKLNFDL